MLGQPIVQLWDRHIDRMASSIRHHAWAVVALLARQEQSPVAGTIAEARLNRAHLRQVVPRDRINEPVKRIRAWLESQNLPARADQRRSQQCVVTNICPDIDKRHSWF